MTQSADDEPEPNSPSPDADRPSDSPSPDPETPQDDSGKPGSEPTPADDDTGAVPTPTEIEEDDPFDEDADPPEIPPSEFDTAKDGLRARSEQQEQEQAKRVEGLRARLTAAGRDPVTIDWIIELTTISIDDLVERVSAMQHEFGHIVLRINGFRSGAGPGVMLFDAADKAQAAAALAEAVGISAEEARDLVADLPAVVADNVSRDEADRIKDRLEDAGGSAEVR